MDRTRRWAAAVVQFSPIYLFITEKTHIIRTLVVVLHAVFPSERSDRPQNVFVFKTLFRHFYT